MVEPAVGERADAGRGRWSSQRDADRAAAAQDDPGRDGRASESDGNASGEPRGRSPSGAVRQVRLGCRREQPTRPDGAPPSSPSPPSSRAASTGPTSPPTQRRGADTGRRPERPSAPPASTRAQPSTGRAGVAFPLAVVTGLANLKATITLDELTELASEGRLGRAVRRPGRRAGAGRSPPTAWMPMTIAGAIQANPDAVALLPPGLVEPATKVLPIAGDGPYRAVRPGPLRRSRGARPAVPGPAARRPRTAASTRTGPRTTPPRSGR